MLTHINLSLNLFIMLLGKLVFSSIMVYNYLVNFVPTSKKQGINNLYITKLL